MLNAIIALAAVVPATVLTLYFDSMGFLGGQPRDGGLLGSLILTVQYGSATLGPLAAGGIAYGVLLALVGHLVAVNRLVALLTAPIAAVPVWMAGWNQLSLAFVALLGSYCVLVGLVVRLPPEKSTRPAGLVHLRPLDPS